MNDEKIPIPDAIPSESPPVYSAPAPPSNSKKSRKKRWIFVALVLLLLLFWFLRGIKPYQQPTQTKQVEKIWRTYKDEVIGFTLEYPKEWHIKISDYNTAMRKDPFPSHESLLATLTNELSVNVYVPATPSSSSSVLDQYLATDDPYINVTKTERMVATRSAVTFETSDTDGREIKGLYVGLEGGVLRILYGKPLSQTGKPEDPDVFSHILSSLKFF